MRAHPFILLTMRSWVHLAVCFRVCVCVYVYTVQLFCLNSLSHPVNLAFHNLFSLCLPPTLSAASHFAVYCWKPLSLQGAGQPENTSGVGVVAAERDGYNNPCSGSTHVLNYCHNALPSGHAKTNGTIQLSQALMHFPFPLHNCNLTKSVHQIQVQLKVGWGEVVEELGRWHSPKEIGSATKYHYTDCNYRLVGVVNYWKWVKFNQSSINQNHDAIHG